MVGHLTAPLQLVANWPHPTEPMVVADGAVHYDLVDDDLETLALLRHSWDDIAHLGESIANTNPPLSAENLAAKAQQWRLAVTPYRTLGPHSRIEGLHPGDLPPLPPDERDGAARALVLDLTALWAGPLATSLLCDEGIGVIKINPSCRPDGFGEHAALYQHLNRHKKVVDLDLRVDSDRAEFEALVQQASLVIDSFSPRVMPNFGYDSRSLRSINPTVATMSIVGFSRNGPQGSWISYGPGVHAASGLADLDRGVGGKFRPAPIAYPDVLAGFAAFAHAHRLITICDADRAQSRHQEIALDQVLGPIVDKALGVS